MAGTAVQVSGRFVGQENGRFGRQGTGDSHPLLLAAGKLPRQAVQLLFQPQGGDYLTYIALIYFTTILGISPSLYEAADIDGATRFQMVRYIVLPALVTPMVTMFILNLGFFLNAGFDQVLNFTNAAVNSSIEILDTYIYSIGIGQGQYSLATAVGLVKGVFGVMLVLLTHVTSKRLTGTGVW